MSDYKQTRDAAGKITTQYDKMLRNLDDDLVKRLRDLGDHASFEPHMHHTAADRIEELEAHLARYRALYEAAKHDAEAAEAALPAV